MLVHNALIFVDAVIPYVVGLLVLPLIVKARVCHVFAHQQSYKRVSQNPNENTNKKSTKLPQRPSWREESKF